MKEIKDIIKETIDWYALLPFEERKHPLHWYIKQAIAKELDEMFPVCTCIDGMDGKEPNKSCKDKLMEKLKKRLGIGERERMKVRRCKYCRCTDKRACPGGCSWINQDTCSECAKYENTFFFDSKKRLGIGDSNEKQN